MDILIRVDGKTYVAKKDSITDISLPVHSGEEQLGAFHLPPATFEPFKAGTFVGDTREGAGVNCEKVVFYPHGNGTHTECVGHITKRRISIAALLAKTCLIVPAVVLTIDPEPIGQSGDDYGPPHGADELVISKRILVDAMTKCQNGHAGFAGLFPHIKACIIRTLPNAGKLQKQYSGNNPTYFTPAATKYLSEELGIDHLLVDLPSVDREQDEGKLLSHRAFWCMSEEALESVGDEGLTRKTITELCSVPDAFVDGPCLLDLQIAAFQLDCAPSRPVLYRLAVSIDTI